MLDLAQGDLGENAVLFAQRKGGLQLSADHPFAIYVEPDEGREHRFRWTIMENGDARHFSPVTFPSWSDAAGDAYLKMRELVDAWRLGLPSAG
jgi:hypothetical protein